MTHRESRQSKRFGPKGSSSSPGGSIRGTPAIAYQFKTSNPTPNRRTKTMTHATTSTVTTAFTAETPLAELRAFAEVHQLPIEGHKGRKATYLAAITAHFAPQIEAAIEVIEPIVTEVEPAAQSIESVAVTVFQALTSPAAIRAYRGALRTALVAAYLAVMLVITIGAWLWDLIDGEPAVIAWIRSYAKSAQGQALREWFSGCRRSAQSIPQQWAVATMFNQE
jgi:hypothetical protein